MVAISRKIELDLIGKISNLAHHFTAALSKKENLLYIDLRTNGYKNLTFPNDDYRIVICDTGLEIENPEKICNERIEECEVGVKGLRLYIWGIKNLRDVGQDFLQKHIKMIPQRVFKRCEYNVLERIRVENSLKHLKGKDYSSFGKQIFNSHTSLAYEYQLSSSELDFLIDKARQITGVLGAKMISCSPLRSTLNIVSKNHLEEFLEIINKEYSGQFEKELNIHVLNFSAGIKSTARSMI